MAIDAPISSGNGFVITDGAHCYEVVRPWQRPGADGSDIGALSQLALDRRDRVFVLSWRQAREQRICNMGHLAY